MSIPKGATLIEQEEMEKGSVSYKVYLFYFHAMTWFMSISSIFGYIAHGAFTAGTNFWLSSWSEAGISADNVILQSSQYRMTDKVRHQ